MVVKVIVAGGIDLLFSRVGVGTPTIFMVVVILDYIRFGLL